MVAPKEPFHHEPTRAIDQEGLDRVPAGGRIPGEAADGEPLPLALGPYRVIRRLGRGGMGDVLLAFDETLSRTIALKRIRPELFHARDIRQRFEIEAMVTSMLQHPSIVPIYQFVSEKEELFYAMRPVEGVTLKALLDELRQDRPGVRDEWPAARLVRLFLQAASAVAYAHSRGVIHRDLKPANIMIGKFEEVLVLDWGMAKRVDGDAAEPRSEEPLESLRVLTADTAPRAVVGTPSYMAPQQLAGTPATIASDIFSLGVILYELLALTLPWEAESLGKLYEARKKPPEMPTRMQPGRGIPHDLARAALKAIEFEPEKRFLSVSSFSKEVAYALEGRASWRLAEKSLERGSWRFAGGRLADEGGEIVLRSGGLLRYFCVERFSDNVRVEFEFSIPKGRHELSVWLHSPVPRLPADGAGYSLMVLPGGRRTLSLLRSGRVVAGASSPRYKPGEWYTVAATREDDRFSLSINGETMYVHHDPIPLRGEFVGLSARSTGLRIRNLRTSSRGTSATVSCLAIPDTFFNRHLYEEARAEYEAIAASQPGRNEGRLAGFRAGLCLLEMAEHEADAGVRSLLLEEAAGAFSKLAAAANDSCLSALGQAMVAAAGGDLARKQAALARAFEAYPGDSHLPAVHEWLLGKLHAAASGQRRVVAELMPLAISYCMDGWGESAMREIMQRVHAEWEVPSFMTSRGRFAAGDRACHAEAKLFFGFWSARPEVIERALAELSSSERFRPHHLADATFSLIATGHAERAREVLAGAERTLRHDCDLKRERAAILSRSAVLAAAGDLEEADSLLSSVPPDPSDRVYNSARLLHASACFQRGEYARTFKRLRPLGPQERFSREHLAWFYLQLGDAAAAEKQLAPLLERNDHRTGKTLCNFLNGVALILRGREEEALRVFSHLPGVPWPRTWTLGSHYALGRLGNGSLEAYVRGAFPFERKTLATHAELLARARGEPPESLPPALSAP